MKINTKPSFKLRWKRRKHLKNGHPFENSIKLDSFKSENHPQSQKDYIFTINMRQCEDCGLVFFDNGLERR